MPDLTGVSHVGLTVTDLDRSVAWYTDVLGFVLFAPTDAPGMRRVLLVHPTSKLLLGLTQHESGSGDAFSETRTGLDHFAFAVADRDDLAAWAERLAEKGADATEIKDVYYGSCITVRDPDGIQLELFVPPATMPT